MNSLQNLCYEKITDAVQQAPPFVQEIIMDETVERMENRLINSSLSKAKDKVYKLYNNTLPALVSDMVADNLRSIRTGGLRTNFLEEYPSLDTNLYECALRISEQIMRTLDIEEFDFFN